MGVSAAGGRWLENLLWLGIFGFVNVEFEAVGSLSAESNSRGLWVYNRM